MYIPAVCYRGAGREHGSVMMNGSRNIEFEIDSTMNMNKRNYNKPEVTIVKIAYQAALLNDSPESDPSHTARGASFSDFDIEE
jgi:hypothetical protein